MKIVIPKPNTKWREFIKKGSGIVMLAPNKSNVCLIYFEGNLYNSANLRTYAERIQCAAGRAHTRYPTIAFAGVLEKSWPDFVHVGNCYPENGYEVHLHPHRLELILDWIEDDCETAKMSIL